MSSIKHHILELFRDTTQPTLSTSQIVDKLYPSLRQSADAILSYQEITPAKRKELMAEKARYHRKVLYHLQTLVEEDILVVDTIKGKGEKVFRLLIQPGESITIGSKVERIRFMAQHTPLTPLEKYEASSILYRYEPHVWTERYNALLLEAGLYETTESLAQAVYDAFHIVNDVVGLNDFETFIHRVGVITASEFFEEISRYATDYHKQICLIFDITNILADDVIQKFLFILTKSTLDNVSVIFDVTPKEVLLHKDFFFQIGSLFATQHLKLNVKNDDMHSAPYIIGRAGPYTISPKKWQTYLRESYAKKMGVVFSQTTVVVDIQKFFTQYSHAKDFELLLKDVCKSLFIGVLEQQKAQQSPQNVSFQKRLPVSCMYSHSTIRFLHYMQPKDSQFSEIYTLLQNMQEHIRQFASMQERLYESCGMPITFDIQLSQAYRKFSADLTLYDIHDRFSITSQMEIFGEKFKEYYTHHEKMKDIFGGGVEIRLIREGKISEHESIGEILSILTAYSYPLLCYQYKTTGGDHAPLEDFFQK
ncbi:MAG: hypothetical protein ACMXYA_02575 [Candidatus Woesearchaeota archaeon]